MAEPVGEAARWHRDDQTTALGLVNGVEQIALGQRGRQPERGKLELGAGDSGDLEHRRCGRGEPVD